MLKSEGRAPSFASFTLEFPLQLRKKRRENLIQVNRPQHDRPFAGVIAQQYSSDIRVSLLFIPNWRVSKSCYFSFFQFFLNKIA
jgi:hypothetical protein